MGRVILILSCALAACSSFHGVDLPTPDGGSSLVDARADTDADMDADDAGDPQDGSQDSQDGSQDTQDAGCALYTHSAGDDAGWTDCNPLGTFTQAQALAACKAWSAGAFGCTVTPGICATQTQGARTSTAAPRGWSLTGTVSQDDGTGVCHPDGTWQ